MFNSNTSMEYFNYIFIFLSSIMVFYYAFSFLLAAVRIRAFGKKMSVLSSLAETNKNMSLFAIFGSLFLFLFVFLLFVIAKELIFLAGSLVALTLFLQNSLMLFLSRNNGVYEGGIILGIFIKNEKMVSYKIINDNEISVRLKNKSSVNLKSNGNNKKIIEVFEHNNIPSEH